MAKASAAHEFLKEFAFDLNLGKENAGIAISIELMRRLVQISFAEISSQAAELFSTTQFKVDGRNYDLSFDVALDTSNVHVAFDKIISAGLNAVVPVIRSQNIGTALSVFIHPDTGAPRIPVARILIDFTEIATALILDKLAITLSLLENRQTGRVEKSWESDAALETRLRDDLGFSDDTFIELSELMSAIRLITPDEIAAAYIDSLNLPDVFALFPGVIFEGQARTSAEGDFLLFTADTRLNFEQCPIAPTSGIVTTEPNPGKDGVFVPDGSPSKEFPKDSAGKDFSGELTRDGHVFLFAPKKLFEVNFEGIARPAVGFSDSGRKGIFRWGYSLSLMLEKFVLSITGKPLEFLISMKLNGLGFGDAGVKIGSVYWRAVGIAFRGDIDPIDILFRIALDFHRKEVVLISSIARAEAKNFNFMVGAPFPLDKIAEFVLEKAAEKAIKDQAGRILTTTRIPIGRWLPLETVATLANVLAFHEDKEKDSVTIGAVLQL